MLVQADAATSSSKRQYAP